MIEVGDKIIINYMEGDLTIGVEKALLQVLIV